MNVGEFIITVGAIVLVTVVVLDELGAYRTLSHLGRWVIRAGTFGRIRVADDQIDDTAVVVVGAGTVVAALVGFCLLARVFE